MNKITMMIRSKGYTLPEFCNKVGISLRTYRRWEKEQSKFNSRLIDTVKSLEAKNERV